MSGSEEDLHRIATALESIAALMLMDAARNRGLTAADMLSRMTDVSADLFPPPPHRPPIWETYAK